MRLRTAIWATLAASSAVMMTNHANADRWRDPPRGSGTEIGVTHPEDEYRAYEGPELGGFIGGGYGLGVGGRLGYVFNSGWYAGGSFTYYTENASFVGAEAGYKFFPAYRWELRPYLFMGPAFIRVGDTGFGRASADTVLAVQPGFLTAYHFGRAFVSGELRAYLTPNPGALAAFGGLGVSL